jgi:hypothetical protein
MRKIFTLLVSLIFFYAFPPGQSPVTGSGRISGPGSILGLPASPPSGATFEVNGTPTTSQTTINFQNSSPFLGLTASFINLSAGNVQAVLSGSPLFAGGSNTQFQYNCSGAECGTGGYTWNASNGTPALSLGSITTDINPFPITWTTNNSGQVFNGLKLVVTNTNQATGSFNYQFCGGTSGTTCVQIDPFGNVKIPGSLSIGSGSVAGNWNFLQGSLPGITANSWQITAPASVGTAFQWVGPSAGYPGVVQLNGSSPTLTLSTSGDNLHSARGTGITAAIGTSTLCLAAACPSGEYQVSVHFDSTNSCSSVGSAQVGLLISFTDDAGTKTGLSVPLTVNGSATMATGLALGNTTNIGWGTANIWTTGVNPIQFQTSYIACTTGTGTYSYSIEVVHLQ